MGELFVRINLPHGEVKKIEPIERKLVTCEDYDQDWHRWRGLTIDNVLHREHGGLILGEGDSGKSTFVKMLAERAEEHRPVKILRLARDSIKAEQIQKEVDEIGRQNGILILDGLDEKQELRYDIAEICERRHNCAIWVTSRPCDAATHLQTNCEIFEKPFRLMDFSDEDIRLISARVGVDYTPFIKTLRTAGLKSFISKPGGTILMLCKYLNGKISRKGRVDAMEELLEDFALTTRDGTVVRQTTGATEIKELVEATRWMAATLFLSGKSSLWIGSPDCEPESALPFDKLPFEMHSKATCLTALERRIFEPLTVDNLRLTYADMLPYLAGSYLARNYGKDILERIIPTEGGVLSRECADVISWMGQINPEICLPWIAKRPLAFAYCHEAIEMFGVERYYQAIVADTSNLLKKVNNPVRSRFDVSLGKRLDGLQPLLDLCIERLGKIDLSESSVEFEALHRILAEYGEGWIKASETILSRTDLLSANGTLKYYAICELRYYISCELKATDTLPQNLTKTILSFLRDESQSGKMHFFKALILSTMHPECVSKEELIPFLKTPFTIPKGGSPARIIVHLLKDAGLDWYREQIPDEKQLRPFPGHDSIRSRHLPECYVRTICNIAQKDKQRAIQSLIRIGDKFDHGEFYKIQNVLGPYFALDILKTMVMQGDKRNIKQELSTTCTRFIDREMDDELYKAICSDLLPWCQGTRLERVVNQIKYEYLERTNKPKLTLLDISSLTEVKEDQQPTIVEEMQRIVEESVVPEIKQLHEDHEKQNKWLAFLPPLRGFIDWIRGRGIEKSFDNRYSGTEDIKPPIRQQAVRDFIDYSYKVKIVFTDSTAKKYSEGTSPLKACEHLFAEHPEYAGNGGYKDAKEYYKSVKGYLDRKKNPIKLGDPVAR